MSTEIEIPGNSAEEEPVKKWVLICEEHGVFAIFYTALCAYCAREKRKANYERQKDVRSSS